MARLYLAVHMRWWIGPYMKLCIAVIWFLAPVLSERRADGLVNVLVAPVHAHGMKVVTTPDDPGECC